MKFKNYLFVIPKRFLSVALASTLVFGSVSTIASAMQNPAQKIFQQGNQVANQQAEIWDGSVDTNWYYQHEEDTLYKIKNAKELAGLAHLVNNEEIDFKGKKIMLTASIDFSRSPNLWKPIGLGVLRNDVPCPLDEEKSRPFKGTFNGNKQPIKGIKTDDQKEVSGLFGVNRGIIKNVSLVDSSINGKYFVGGVAGFNIGLIEDSGYAGSVIAKSNVENKNASTGGVVGINKGKIFRSYNTGSVSSSGIYSLAGGVVGYNSLGTIQNSYNIGSVNNNGNSSYSGGISAWNSGDIGHSYYNKEIKIKGQTISQEGDAKTTAEMQNLQFTEDLLGNYFLQLQNKKINKGYPILKFRLKLIYQGMIDRNKKELNIMKEKIDIDYARYKNIIKGKIDIDYAKKKLPSQDLKNSTADKAEMKDQLLKIINEFEQGLDQNKNIDEQLAAAEAKIEDQLLKIINEFEKDLDQNKNIDKELDDAEAQRVLIEQEINAIIPNIYKLNKEELNNLIEKIDMVNDDLVAALYFRNIQCENQETLYKNLDFKIKRFENMVRETAEEYQKRFPEGLSRK